MGERTQEILLIVKRYLFFIFIIVLPISSTKAQALSDDNSSPNPRTAFLKSLALPGWGHHYVNQSDWTRGKYHLAADVVLIVSFLGLNIHSNNIRQHWYAYSQSEAGINIEGRARSLQLAIGNFQNLEAYNDFQARSRNWDQFIEDTPENRWNWQSDAARAEYNDLRNRFANIDQQLPALVGLMVVNRVVSAISAYNRARKISDDRNQAALYFSQYRPGTGLLANLKVHF